MNEQKPSISVRIKPDDNQPENQPDGREGHRQAGVGNGYLERFCK